jgi:hypothetical protein
MDFYTWGGSAACLLLAFALKLWLQLRWKNDLIVLASLADKDFAFEAACLGAWAIRRHYTVEALLKLVHPETKLPSHTFTIPQGVQQVHVSMLGGGGGGGSGGSSHYGVGGGGGGSGGSSHYGAGGGGGGGGSGQSINPPIFVKQQKLHP